MNWTLYSISDFDRLSHDWDGLNARAGALPFLDARFVRPLCEVFGDEKLRIARCEDGEGTVALGIFHRRGAVQWETFQPSQCPLGAWLCRPGSDSETLLAQLAPKLPGATLAIGITQQDPDCHPRPAESSRLTTLDYIETARLPICGSFDDYWSARGKNLRHNMKRQRAKLAAEGVTTRLEVLTSPNDVAAAIEDYGRLESAGWKASGGTAIHPDNAQGRFYRTMLEDFCRAGLGRIYRYRFNDRIVALDLCIEGGGILAILKTTYDESIKTISPAFLMREEAFRLLFDEARLKAVEFYGKVMEWHLRWTSDVRTLYHVTYFRSPLVRKLHGLPGRLSRSASQPFASSLQDGSSEARPLQAGT